jgi:uncharacterized membrane protein
VSNRDDRESQHGPSEHDLEQLIGRALQIGVLLSAAVVAVGAVGLIARHGHEVPDFHIFRGATSPLRDLGAIARAVRQGDSRAIVQLGLVLLIATPVARVALTLVAFLVRRDRLYVVLSSVVLALLVFGLVWGRA